LTLTLTRTSTLTPTLTLTPTPTLTPTLPQALGLQLFTAIATLSTLLFWSGFSSGRVRVAVACAAVGLLGPVRTPGHRALALALALTLTLTLALTLTLTS